MAAVFPLSDSQMRSEQELLAVWRRASVVAEGLGYSSEDQAVVAASVIEAARHAFGDASPVRVAFSVATEPAPELRVHIGPIAATSAEGRPRPAQAVLGACHAMDRWEASPAEGGGAALLLAKELPDTAEPPDDRALERIARSAADAATGDPQPSAMEGLIRQSRSVLALAERARAADADAHALAAELEETNRGVLALYADLETKAGQFRELNDTLEQRVAERSAESRRRAEQLRTVALQLNEAEQRERRRIAQTLHDNLQQLLVAAKMHLGLVRHSPPERVSERIEQAGDLLDDSIELSRSLTVELSPPVLHQSGLVAAVEWLAQRVQKQHRLGARLAVRGREPELADHLKVVLFQAVQELLFNTVKHAGVDEAAITIDARDRARMRITVEDRGAGFDAAHLDERRADGGFGLLSMGERIEWLGGRLEVESRPGAGTRSTITMPLTVGDGPAEPAALPPATHTAPPTTADPPAPARSPNGGHAIRVLLADDHKLVREGLANIIRSQADMTVVAEASTGDEAVGMARRFSPHVIVMDVNMPHMDGIEATRRILEQMPGARIIGLSMHDAADIAREMRQAGASDYLTKDRAAESLCEAVRNQSTPT